jgi:type VI protein secretion system component Hcp
MASDAFMELSDPETWGESVDAQFEKRGWGAFEISQFSFGTMDKSDDDDDDDDDNKKGHHGARHHHSKHSHGSHSSKNKEHTIKEFTIHKPIDKGSLDIFLCCLEKKRINWAKVFMREVGEASQHPWLMIEFQGVFVESFEWSLSPGVAGEEAKDQETIKFTFETILIKYSRQIASGEHAAVKIKGWNTLTNDRQTEELEKDRLEHSFDSDDTH